MGANTNIAWTRSSWSPWIGCTEVSPGCTNCYARVLDQRYRYGGGVHWGHGVPRHRTAKSSWRHPIQWNKSAGEKRERWTVFPSLCDPFDNEVPEEWRQDLGNLIQDTPNLVWLLLTKRVGNANRMLGDMFLDGPPDNIWIGASVVNQEESDRDIPKLLATPAAKRFVSYEPALSAVDFSPWLGDKALKDLVATFPPGAFPLPAHLTPRPAIDWLIIGGESAQGGAKARPFDIGWARSTVVQCKASSVPVFVKQIGSNAFVTRGGQIPYRTKDRAGADYHEWPPDLQIQEFPT